MNRDLIGTAWERLMSRAGTNALILGMARRNYRLLVRVTGQTWVAPFMVRKIGLKTRSGSESPLRSILSPQMDDAQPTPSCDYLMQRRFPFIQ